MLHLCSAVGAAMPWRKPDRMHWHARAGPRGARTPDLLVGLPAISPYYDAALPSANSVASMVPPLAHLPPRAPLPQQQQQPAQPSTSAAASGRPPLHSQGAPASASAGMASNAVRIKQT
jgi:hypothetical protein